MSHQHDLDCKDILENLNDYIDGDLDVMLCGEIESHIQACSNCRIVVNTLKKTIHLYQMDGQETTLPHDIRKRLFASLDLDDYVSKD